MIENQYVIYYRVSTVRQGLSGLGLDAQRQTVTQYLAGGCKTVLAEFVEVETGGQRQASLRSDKSGGQGHRYRPAITNAPSISIDIIYQRTKVAMR